MTNELGTDSNATNSSGEIIEGRQPPVVQESEGKRTTPPIVAFTKTGDGRVTMHKPNSAVDLIKMGLGIALLAAVTGCVGYVGGGYGAAVVVPGPPDVFFYGGPYYERGRDVHEYSHRGFESRAVAHPGGGGHERRR
jgi:hypothetical protein